MMNVISSTNVRSMSGVMLISLCGLAPMMEVLRDTGVSVLSKAAVEVRTQLFHKVLHLDRQAPDRCREEIVSDR